MFDQTLGFLDHHLGHGNVTGRGFVEGRGHNLAFDGALHVRHLFRAFVDQKNDQIAFRVVLLDRVSDVLQDHRFTRTRRGHDQRTLALPDRGNQIDHPGRAVFDGGIFDLHLQALIRIERRQVVESHLVFRVFRIAKVDLLDLGNREIILVLAGGLNDALHRVTGAQRILADHVRRNINVIGAGQIVCLGRAQETKAVLQHFQHPIPTDDPFFIRTFTQDREHDVPFAHSRGVLDLELFSDSHQLFRAFGFQIG